MNEQEVFEEIEKARKTRMLSLRNQTITDKVWADILTLSKLEWLWFHNCIFNLFPSKINSFLPKLTELELDSCQLTTFPTIFTECPNLTRIVINDNKLQDLPKEFSKLKKLKTLNAYSNQFEVIPKVIFEITTLEFLDLNANKINFIPKEINKLKQLQNIGLDYNKIVEIPKEITVLEKLEELHIYNNPIKEIANEIDPKFLKGLDLELALKNEKLVFVYNLSSANISKLKPVNSNNNSIENSQFFDYSNIINLLQNKSTLILKSNQNFVLISFGDPNLFFEKKDIPIQIIVYGKKRRQNKEFLSTVRKNFEKWLNILDLKPMPRLFFYPINEEKEALINYDLLVHKQQAEEYDYYDFNSDKGFPISDLFDYIDLEEAINKNPKWEVTGHLTKVQIKNLKLFEDINFNLSSSINIVLGHNGLGKTSVLQAITLGLLSVSNTDKSDKFAHYIHFGNERAEISVTYAENEQRVVHLISRSLIDLNKLGVPAHILLAYGVNLNADEKLSPQFFTELIEGNSKLYATESIFKPYSNDFNDPLVVLYELERESKLNPECRKLIDLIVNKINAYLALVLEGERMQLIEEKGFYYFEDFNKNKLQLHHLSEGYKDHILLITDIFLRIIASRKSWASENTEFVSSTIFEEAKGVILIDEFDRHLHPVWQRRLLFELKNDFPNIQFILTTHNVFSLQSAVGANAIQLVVKEGEIQVETKTIERKNILGIIDEFYTEDFFDYEAQQELSLFSKYLDKIHDGGVDFVYSDEFKTSVKNLYDMGDEIQTSIASQLLHLNSTLKKLGKKRFEL